MESTWPPLCVAFRTHSHVLREWEHFCFIMCCRSKQLSVCSRTTSCALCECLTNRCKPHNAGDCIQVVNVHIDNMNAHIDEIELSWPPIELCTSKGICSHSDASPIFGGGCNGAGDTEAVCHHGCPMLWQGNEEWCEFPAHAPCLYFYALPNMWLMHSGIHTYVHIRWYTYIQW